MKKLREGKKHKASGQKPEPHVGIFWVVRGKLVIDITPLSDGEPYGDNLTHPRSHIEVREQWRLGGEVPGESEYEDSPRGRVMFNTKTQKFTLLADRCILKNQSMVRKIVAELNLPRRTETGTDEHYQCSACGKAREGE